MMISIPGLLLATGRICLTGILSLFSMALSAQLPKPLAACRLVGVDSLAAGTAATYSLIGCKAGSWQLSCGTITARTDSTVTVFFDSAGCASAAITALSGGQTTATLTVQLTAALPLDGGSIAAGNQTVGWRKFPAPLTPSAARQGLCNGVYSYQWYSSTDNQHFQPIAGATGQQFQPGTVDSTTYFKRKVLCGADSAYTTAIAIHPNPPLSTTAITPAVQAINYQDPAAGLSVAVITGGNGQYSYQWQSTTDLDDHAWQSIGGANGSAYTPGRLDTTTFFRLITVSNGDSLYSIRTVVSVFPMLVAGAITATAPGDSAAGSGPILTLNGPSGGTGVYGYQWYSSTDGQRWNSLGQTQTAAYAPSALTTTTYYRVIVTSNGATATSAPVTIQANAAVNP